MCLSDLPLRDPVSRRVVSRQPQVPPFWIHCDIPDKATLPETLPANDRPAGGPEPGLHQDTEAVTGNFCCASPHQSDEDFLRVLTPALHAEALPLTFSSLFSITGVSPA